MKDSSSSDIYFKYNEKYINGKYVENGLSFKNNKYNNHMSELVNKKSIQLI